MADRVVVRGIIPGGDHPRIGPAITVPGEVGEPTLASFGGRLALLLWRSPDRAIGLRRIDVAGPEPRFGREEESGSASAVPVAAVEARDGETPALCVGLVEPTDPNHRSWTEVRRFVHTPEGRWRESRRQWVNGEVPDIDGARPFAVHAAHRLLLLWRPEPGFEARGRLYHFSGGGTTADRPWSDQYITAAFHQARAELCPSRPHLVGIAIDYAHSRGVLRRDIKPGNIIVGKPGATLVVNWGLAKPLGRVDPAHTAVWRTLVPSLDTVQSPAYCKMIGELPGYDSAETGELQLIR